MRASRAAKNTNGEHAGYGSRVCSSFTPLFMRLWYTDFQVVQVITKYSNSRLAPVLLWRGSVAALLVVAQPHWHVVESSLMRVVMFHGPWQKRVFHKYRVDSEVEIKTLLSGVMGADAPAGDGSAEEPSRAVAVLQLLAAVLEESPSNRQSFAQLSGTPVIMHHCLKW